MALGGTDLNLLLPLKVLLEEGNVTRAGQRLELSQPAMSAALARLRRRFDDELLVRAGATTSSRRSRATCCPRCSRPCGC